MQYTGFNKAMDIIDNALALSSDPRIDDIGYIIGDFSECTDIEGNEDDVKVLAAYNTALSKINPNIINPTIMPNKENVQAMISLYVLITEEMPWKTGWVHSLNEAREWIDQQACVLSQG